MSIAKKKSPRCPRIYDAVLERMATLSLAPGVKVLDAPCGDGEVATALAKDGIDVSGIDIVDELTAEARKSLGDRFRIGDLTAKLPWPDQTFDVVMCVEGIEHLENAFEFTREVYRVCKPGAVFVITTPNLVSIRSRVRFFGSGFYLSDPRPLDEGERDPLHHIGLKTYPELRYMLHTSGFEIFGVQPTHVKPISYAYGFLAPWMWLYTLIAFRKERDKSQRARNREIRRALGSRALLFGENILICARKMT